MIMSNLNTILDLQSQTSAQMALDAEARRQDAINGRGNANNAMGKHDFLMLLVAQLRHQNPLEPQNDNEFAAQLANFAQLEQLENLNNSMQDMARQQAFGLIGKFVIGEVQNGNSFEEVAGIVESIFVRGGELFASIGGIAVPVSSITDVFDTGEMITPRMLIEISNSLVGRYVKAEYYREPDTDNGETVPVLVEIQGVVERVTVDDGQLFAYIRNQDGDLVRAPVGAIFDIGQFHVPAATFAALLEPEEDEDGDGDGEKIPGGNYGNDNDPEVPGAGYGNDNDPEVPGMGDGGDSDPEVPGGGGDGDDGGGDIAPSVGGQSYSGIFGNYGAYRG
jgi:flagellar basal-body rod modification protein FlgD